MPQVVVLQKERKVAHYKRLATIIVAALVLCVAAVITYIVMAAADYAAVSTHAKALGKAGNVAGEIEALTNYMAKNPMAQYRYSIAVQLGDLTLAQNSYDAAFKWYFEAAALTDDPPVHLFIGLAKSSEGMHDNATAVTYYKKALKKMSGDSEERAVYEDEVRGLGGTP